MFEVKNGREKKNVYILWLGRLGRRSVGQVVKCNMSGAESTEKWWGHHSHFKKSKRCSEGERLLDRNGWAGIVGYMYMVKSKDLAAES